MNEEIINKLNDLSRRLEQLEVQENHNFSRVGILANDTVYTGTIFVPLPTPLTSTSYNGDDTVTTGTYTIDTSSVFGAPVGIKAAVVFVQAVWAVSNNNEMLFRTTASSAPIAGLKAPQNTNNTTFIIPCDSNGDFHMTVAGANAGFVIIRISGYFI